MEFFFRNVCATMSIFFSAAQKKVLQDQTFTEFKNSDILCAILIIFQGELISPLWPNKNKLIFQSESFSTFVSSKTRQALKRTHPASVQ